MAHIIQKTYLAIVAGKYPPLIPITRIAIERTEKLQKIAIQKLSLWCDLLSMDFVVRHTRDSKKGIVVSINQIPGI